MLLKGSFVLNRDLPSPRTVSNTAVSGGVDLLHKVGTVCFPIIMTYITHTLLYFGADRAALPGLRHFTNTWLLLFPPSRYLQQGVSAFLLLLPCSVLPHLQLYAYPIWKPHGVCRAGSSNQKEDLAQQPRRACLCGCSSESRLNSSFGKFTLKKKKMKANALLC